MMKHTPPHLPIVLAACGFAILTFLLTGCHSLQAVHDNLPPPRVSGYAALYDLMNRNAGVSKLLIFKTVDPPVKQAIDEFARQCAEAAKQIRQFAENDPSIDLNAAWLTPIEQQTRAGIESDTSTALLTGFGKEFQTHLLISQTDAAQYGSHLAASIAKLDDNQTRKKYLNDLSDQLAKTHKQLFKLLEPPSP
ncbi:MAG: hypothetical protein WC058_16315 [Phycisphaeraceae bacterium]